jgi:hypothetical protein
MKMQMLVHVVCSTGYFGGLCEKLGYANVCVAFDRNMDIPPYPMIVYLRQIIANLFALTNWSQQSMVLQKGYLVKMMLLD